MIFSMYITDYGHSQMTAEVIIITKCKILKVFQLQNKLDWKLFEGCWYTKVKWIEHIFGQPRLFSAF